METTLSSDDSENDTENEYKIESDTEEINQSYDNAKCYPTIKDTSFPLLCLPPDSLHFIDCFEEDYNDNQVTSKVKPSLKLPNLEQKGKKKKKNQLTVCLTYSRYDAVARAMRRFGFREVGEEDNWNLMWTDCCVTLQRMMDIQKYQKINHFPGMIEICRKDLLSRNLNRLLKLFPNDYNFFPRSYHLPADFNEFQCHSKRRRKAVYILKPENGCQGRGIRLVKNYKEVDLNEHALCQQYISKPYLIDGLKFDLRIYVLVTSSEPLRIYVFKDGLARFATVIYYPPSRQNLNNVYMHLTNYAINKSSEGFIADENSGTKRRISTVNNYLQKQGHDVTKLWQEIDDCIIKTIISIKSTLERNHKTIFLKHANTSACFEILGFDILLDHRLKPYLLEVNHSPSFTADSRLDIEIKDTLIYDTLNITNFNAVNRKKCLEERRKKFEERIKQTKGLRPPTLTKESLEQQQLISDSIAEFEDSHIGNFRRIYPCPTKTQMDYYTKFFTSQPLIYQSTAISRMREEKARLFREKLDQDRNLENDKRLKSPRSILRPEGPLNKIHKQQLSSAQLQQDSRLPTDIDPTEEAQRLAGLERRHTLLRMYDVIKLVRGIVVEAVRQPLVTCREPNNRGSGDDDLDGMDPLRHIDSNESLTFQLEMISKNNRYTPYRKYTPRPSNYILSSLGRYKRFMWQHIN